ETTAGGRRVKVVGHAGKTGWFYIHDRATGKLIRRSQAFVPQDNMFAQPTDTGVRMLPGANGGSEWSPVAYSPDTQMAYVLGLHQPMNYITHAAPISFEVDGEQFIAVAAGGNFQLRFPYGDGVFVFGLPKKR